MALSLAATLKTQLATLIETQFQLVLPELAAEVPPKTELGDLAFPVAFELAKRLKAVTGEKQNPRELAAKLADGLRTVPGVARVEIAGAGYLNVFFDRAALFARLVADQPVATPAPTASAATKSKLIVEHTSINPNKAAHIGHVRNSVLGDTTARILKALGETVEVHNYIDNTGVQVADVVVGFLQIESKTLAEIQALAERPATTRAESFDYYCWDLYARVGQWYEADKTRLQIRAQTLHDIETGNNATAEVAEYVSAQIVKAHLATMARLDITYDLLARESEILHLHFWAHAFEKLKARGVIVYETAGRNQGCWVMRAEEDTTPERAAEAESEHDADKIIVRSNGTVTYTGKDIAYHLWKLGKLGLDFHYRPLQRDHYGQQVWITTSDASAASAAHPPFGNGTAFLNVIDVGQAYPQANVKRAVLLMAESDEQRAKVSRSAHLAYEKVTLSANAARELGVDVAESGGAVSMSGRKGLGVKGDDLIDRLEANALREVRARHADISDEEQAHIAHCIAVAALRYFLLKFTRTSIIAFDFDDALSFTGETGPYILNSVVRAKSIFRKLGQAPESLQAQFAQLTPGQLQAIFTGETGDALWTAVAFAARLDDAIQQAAATLEPNHVVKHTFQLAKQFHLFYETHHILSEANEAKKLTLLLIADLLRRKLEHGLSLLGITVPEKM